MSERMRRIIIIASVILLATVGLTFILLSSNSLSGRGFRVNPETSPTKGYVLFQNDKTREFIQIYKCFRTFNPNEIPNAKVEQQVDKYGVKWYFIHFTSNNTYSLIGFIQTNRCSQNEMSFINVAGKNSNVDYYLKLAGMAISYYNKTWK
jgi:hypothetical protein